MLAVASIALCLTASNPCQVKGRIEIVSSYADADYVAAVVTPEMNALPDLRVRIVDWIANQQGLWRIVDHSPNYRVKLVQFPNPSADFTVQFVNYSPGCR